MQNSNPKPSVCPYASKIGQPRTILKKLRTSGEMGADALKANLTLPPNTYFNLLKTNLNNFEIKIKYTSRLILSKKIKI